MYFYLLHSGNQPFEMPHMALISTVAIEGKTLQKIITVHSDMKDTNRAKKKSRSKKQNNKYRRKCSK